MVSKLPEEIESNEFLFLRRTDSVELFTEGLTFDLTTGLSNDETDNSMAILLKTAGMNTYGDVLDYAKRHFFSELPGVDARIAELIHRQIENAERANKSQAIVKLFHTQDALNKLARTSQEVVADLAKGRID